jgi:phosphoenolpyruvate synthase/pyruvate phosphate dikinase
MKFAWPTIKKWLYQKKKKKKRNLWRTIADKKISNNNKQKKKKKKKTTLQTKTTSATILTTSATIHAKVKNRKNWCHLLRATMKPKTHALTTLPSPLSKQGSKQNPFFLHTSQEPATKA